MINVKISFDVEGKEIVLTESEARSLYADLKRLFVEESPNLPSTLWPNVWYNSGVDSVLPCNTF